MNTLFKQFARAFSAVAMLAASGVGTQVALADSVLGPRTADSVQASQMSKDIAMPYVRWSELEIDPAWMGSFEPLAAENVRETRRTEPGVLAFYSAGEKDHPNQIRVLEIYADTMAYQAHLQSPHFQKFRAGSGQMVKRRQLLEALPIRLGAKPQLPPPDAYMRIAELEIDPVRLDAYKALVSEEIDISIRVEPGVLAIYAFALKDRPNHLRFFEIYADEHAYLLHRAAPHFRTYLDSTREMIVDRKLIETAPSPSPH